MIRALVDFALKSRWLLLGRVVVLTATLGVRRPRSRMPSAPTRSPFAIVIVGGLLANLVIGVFLLSTAFVWQADVDDAGYRKLERLLSCWLIEDSCHGFISGAHLNPLHKPCLLAAGAHFCRSCGHGVYFRRSETSPEMRTV